MSLSEPLTTLSGYRQGWCKACKKVTFSERVQTWNILHFFWIPIFPLGKQASITCEICKNDPRKRTSESATVLVIGAIFLGLMCIASFFGDVPEKDRNGLLIGQAFFGLPSLYCGYKAYKKMSTKEVEEVKYSYPDDKCHYCADNLVLLNNEHYCEKCRVYRIA